MSSICTAHLTHLRKHISSMTAALITHQLPHSNRLLGALSITTMLGSMLLGPLLPMIILVLVPYNVAMAATLAALTIASMVCAGHSPAWCRFYLRSAGFFAKGVFIHFEPRSIKAVSEQPSMWCMHPHGTSIGFGFSLNGAVRLRAEAEHLYLPPAFADKLSIERLRTCNGIQAPGT